MEARGVAHATRERREWLRRRHKKQRFFFQLSWRHRPCSSVTTGKILFSKRRDLSRNTVYFDLVLFTSFCKINLLEHLGGTCAHIHVSRHHPNDGAQQAMSTESTQHSSLCPVHFLHNRVHGEHPRIFFEGHPSGLLYVLSVSH